MLSRLMTCAGQSATGSCVGMGRFWASSDLPTVPNASQLLQLPQVYCLPDNYEVVDRSLDDVRFMLNPRFTQQEVARLDKVGGCLWRPGLGVHRYRGDDAGPRTVGPKQEMAWLGKVGLMKHPWA